MKIRKEETSLTVLYSDPELFNRIHMSEWVKWKPYGGYERLLVAVAMPTCWQPIHFFLSSYKLPTPMSCKHQVFRRIFQIDDTFISCDICTFVFVKFSRL
jgi:hypothetical protein